MRRLRHPNLVLLHEVVDDLEVIDVSLLFLRVSYDSDTTLHQEDMLYLVMDFVPGGPVMDWDGRARRFVSPRTRDLSLSRRGARWNAPGCGLKGILSTSWAVSTRRPRDRVTSSPSSACARWASRPGARACASLSWTRWASSCTLSTAVAGLCLYPSR